MSLFRSMSSAGALMAGLLILGGGGAALARAPAAPDTLPFTPKFAVLPNPRPELAGAAAGGLTTWTFKFALHGRHWSETFVGNPPTGAATTTPSFIIPLKIVVAGETFSPSTIQPDGRTALTDTVRSPIFQSVIDFTQAGADLGTTQYIDAFNRESFWPTVLTNPGYHVLLGTPTVLPEVTLNVPAGSGAVGIERGVKVAFVDINYIFAQMRAILADNPRITPRSVAVFEAYDTYEIQDGGCCIGGFHGAIGGQTYMLFDYIGKTGKFAEDVSALSHEMGEWLNDPFPLTDNNVPTNQSPCGIYENADPLVFGPNFGNYAYVVGGTMTYHLQDLVMPPYFGVPASTSLNGRATFQGTRLAVCQNGP